MYSVDLSCTFLMFFVPWFSVWRTPVYPNPPPQSTHPAYAPANGPADGPPNGSLEAGYLKRSGLSNSPKFICLGGGRPYRGAAAKLSEPRIRDDLAASPRYWRPPPKHTHCKGRRLHLGERLTPTHMGTRPIESRLRGRRRDRCQGRMRGGSMLGVRFGKGCVQQTWKPEQTNKKTHTNKNRTNSSHK